jgi:RNA polymerase sigma factor (sigma-70 family)
MDASDYTQYRPLMFSIAYRMTGSVSDAEDIVQEAFLRAARNYDTADNQKAYLATITTRLAIDHLRSARVRRESYVGTWLPEPLLGGADDTPRPRPAGRDERLPIDGVPRLAGEPVTPRTCRVPPPRGLRLRLPGDRRDHRQDRARLPADLRPRPPPHRRGQAQVRDVPRRRRGTGQPVPGRGPWREHEQLFERLAPDVLFYGDSGGLGEITFATPVAGRDRVAELVRAQLIRTIQLGASLGAAWVNGQPGLLARDADGGLIAVIALDVLDGQVQAIRTVANPDKLRHLGPVSQTWHLRQGE